MIEATNSSIAASAVVRPLIDREAASNSFAADPQKIKSIPKAPFISPFISVDVNLNIAVLQIRESETGEVVRQIPSENQIRAYKDAQKVREEGRDTSQPLQLQEDDGSAVSSVTSNDSGADNSRQAEKVDVSVEDINIPQSTSSSVDSGQAIFA